MKLNGHFEPSSLASVFQILSHPDRTGVLTLASPESEVRIIIREGSVICVTGSDTQTRLGNLLRRRNVITAKDLSYCLSEAHETGDALGQVLVGKGFIGLETLQETLHGQAREVLFNLFFWKGGEFGYQDSPEVPQGALDTEIDIAGVISVARSRLDEMFAFMAEIPSDEIIFQVDENWPGEDPPLPGLSEGEARLWSLIDGTRTVRQIIKDGDSEDYSVYGLLVRLLSSRVIIKKETAVFPEDQRAQRDFSDIVQFYGDILQLLRKNLAMDLDRWVTGVFAEAVTESQGAEWVVELHKRARGRWIFNIMDNCKPRSVRHQEILLSGFSPTSRMEDNVRNVAAAMRTVKNTEKTRMFLARTLHQYVTNLLHTTENAFGPVVTRRMLLGVNHILARVSEHRMQFPEKALIIKDMVDLLIDVASRAKDPDFVRLKSFGVFTVLDKPATPPAAPPETLRAGPAPAPDSPAD
ncbi:MAG: DUF4388 domain-containing protein [Proteobacteria bacterium]|nr:DUF4388 domain-containing protein [Pseudomonadota bacterium]